MRIIFLLSLSLPLPVDLLLPVGSRLMVDIPRCYRVVHYLL